MRLTSSPARHLALRVAALGLGALALTSCADTGDDHTTDDALYVAGHFGLFRVDADGVPARIADRWQDTMAFTVTGPGTLAQPLLDDPGRHGVVVSHDAPDLELRLAWAGGPDRGTQRNHDAREPGGGRHPSAGTGALS